MTELHSKEWSILAKYVCQEATGEEQLQAEQLLTQSDTIKRVVDRFIELRANRWQMEVNEHQAFERLNKRIKSEELI